MTKQDTSFCYKDVNNRYCPVVAIIDWNPIVIWYSYVVLPHPKNVVLPQPKN